MATTRATSKTTTKQSEPSDEEFNEMLAGMVDAIASAIVAGAFDADVAKIDDALEKRTNKLIAEKAAAAKKAAPKLVRKSTAILNAQKEVAKEEKVAPVKRVAAPPKTASVKPVAGTTYLLVPQLGKVGGKKVKYLRNYKVAGKVVVEMLEDAAGNPKGKSIVVPLPALTAVAATPARRRTVKK